MLCIYEHPDYGEVSKSGTGGRHGINHFGLRITDRKAWEETVEREKLEVHYGGEVDWPAFGELFGRHRLTRIARARFSLAARLLGTPMPPGFTLDNGGHLRRCLRAHRSPPLRAALSFVGGISAPLTTRHLDLLYGCGTERGLRLQLYRIRHVFHLVLRHRNRIAEKVRYAAGMYR